MPKVTIEIEAETVNQLNALHDARYGPVSTDGVHHNLDDVVRFGVSAVVEALPRPTRERYIRKLGKEITDNG